MSRKISTLIAIALSTGMYAGQSHGQVADTVRVASGLTRPDFVTAPPGDTTRLFIVEQRGVPSATQARIMILDLTTNPPTLLATPFLTISNVTTGNEQGLLGLAFDPNYQTNFRFYVNYTTTGGGAAGHSVIARYTAPSATANVANVAEQVLLTYDQPETNHNCGWIAFGPDGYLYIGTGDGGGANDQHTTNCATGNGQCLNTVLGKILRIDVSGAGAYAVPPTNPFAGAAAPFNTIWAYGLRNPWRDAFDRMTGQLYIADVGQNAVEEVDVQPADSGGSQGGRNYGWRCMEGTTCTGLTGCTCNAANLVLPITTYTHAGGACSITGGYVYRGSAIPALQGHYFFADYCSNQIFSLQYTGSNNPPVTNRTADLSPSTNGFAIGTITSFGEDASGELYIVDQGGEIFKVIPAPPANDACANATLVGNVTNQAFSTVQASTDGPDEPGSCNFGGYTQIGNDIWFKYLATCTGTVTVSTCGSSFNTKLAVYGPCPAASGAALACNDDFCGTSSQVTFAATQSALYRIRIGGFNGATGTGLLTISCAAPPPCPGDVNDNGVVDIDDLVLVITNWNCAGKCVGDENSSGVVDIDDLVIVITSWGQCP